MNVGSLPTNPTASDICSMVPFLERIGLGSTEREDKEKEGESEEDRKQKEMKEKIIQEYEAGKKKEKEDKITAARLQYEQNLVELQEYSKKADGIPPACLRNFELTLLLRLRVLRELLLLRLQVHLVQILGRDIN